jgi:hypothetical protein
MDSFHITDVLISGNLFAMKQGVFIEYEWAPSRPANVNYFPRLKPICDYLCINSLQSNIKPESTQVAFVEQLKVEMQTKYLPPRPMDDLSTSLLILIPGIAAIM